MEVLSFENETKLPPNGAFVGKNKIFNHKFCSTYTTFVH
jgi:hypothetical protein